MSRKRNSKQLRYKDIPELREKILKEQQFICPICKKEITSPALDHQHKKKINGSGLVRGVLCSNCNVLLGKMENNCTRYCVQQNELPEILVNMSAYLQRKHYPYIHPSEAKKSPKLKKSSYNKLKKAIDGKQKIPDYPKSKQLTKQLKKLFKKYKIDPEFYKS